MHCQTNAGFRLNTIKSVAGAVFGDDHPARERFLIEPQDCGMTILEMALHPNTDNYEDALRLLTAASNKHRSPA